MTPEPDPAAGALAPAAPAVAPAADPDGDGRDPGPADRRVWRQPAVGASLALRLGGALGLAVALALMRFYGLSTRANSDFGAAGSTAVGGWSALPGLRWVLVAAALLALASTVLRPRPVTLAALAGGLVATLWLAWRLLVLPPDPRRQLDVKLGGYLALVACAALALGAWEALDELRFRPSVAARTAPTG